MLLFFPLTLLFSILVLTAAQINTNEKECDKVYSFLNEKSCNQVTNCFCENGFIHSFKLDGEFLNITEFPTEIFTLKNLKQLHISNTEIDSIPPAIGELSELECFTFTLNKLKEIPNELFQLKKLFEIALNFNNIEKIPPGIGELSELEILILRGNKIKELPEELFKLKKLKSLELDRNQIETIPESIGELTELEYLDVSANKIKEMPQSISKLKNLVINRQERLKFNKFLTGIILICMALLM